MSNIGVDIENISRFEEKEYRKNLNFYKKIFTAKEIQYCLKKSNPYKHFTARFCAKEAAIKACDKKIWDLTTIEISIMNDKPNIKLPENKIGVVSLSHTDQYAVAIVMILN
jgi:holo-[acyl-carrier protein] synthase